MTQNEQEIVVRIDPDLADLIPGFLENRRKDVASILAALEQGDHETIRILGHSMKGCGGGYGFDEITELGRSLEKAAKDADADGIRRKTAELSSYLDHLRIIYE
jgi:HPt (histidine-containing phosphotransfer) domain-containing protein